MRIQGPSTPIPVNSMSIILFLWRTRIGAVGVDEGTEARLRQRPDRSQPSDRGLPEPQPAEGIEDACDLETARSSGMVRLREAWVGDKARWSLSAVAEEQAALAEMQVQCP
jgi:hypothetical protein